MAGFSSIGRAIGAIPGVGAIGRGARKLPGVGGIANTLGLPGGAQPLAPRPTNPNLGIATGNAAQTTANNPLGTPQPPGLPDNMMTMAAQAAQRARTRAQGANARVPGGPNAVPTGRTRPLSLLGY